MRVTHFRTTFSLLTETFIYDRVIGTRDAGLDCRVLTLRRENEAERPFDQVDVVSVPSRHSPGRLLSWLAVRLRAGIPGSHLWRAIRRQLDHHLAEHRPDVLHAHFGIEGVIAAPVAREHSIPLLVTHYGFDIGRLGRDRRWRARYREMWDTASAVTVLSSAMKNAVVELGCRQEKVSIIHLGKDLASLPYREPDGPMRRLITIGRLEDKKGHLDAIEAVQRLASEGIPVSLSIVGGGPLDHALARHVDANGLRGTVELAGPRSHAESMERLRRADAFILCSKTAPDGDQEGTPTVLIEAQAVGLPCVTTRHAGISEVIPKESHWLLASEGDVDSIVDRIRALLDAPLSTVREVSARGRERVEAEFDLRMVTEKLERLYESVTA